MQKFLVEVRKEVAFYNKNTELFAFFALIYGLIGGAFLFAGWNNTLIRLFVLVFSLILSVAIMYAAITYLHAVKYGNKNHSLLRIHRVLNKSFKARRLLRFVKVALPDIPLLDSYVNYLKNFGKNKLIPLASSHRS